MLGKMGTRQTRRYAGIKAYGVANILRDHPSNSPRGSIRSQACFFYRYLPAEDKRICYQDPVSTALAHSP